MKHFCSILPLFFIFFIAPFVFIPESLKPSFSILKIYDFVHFSLFFPFSVLFEPFDFFEVRFDLSLLVQRFFLVGEDVSFDFRCLLIVRNDSEQIEIRGHNPLPHH